MRHNTIFLLLVAIFCSCRTSRCVEDKDAIEEFNQKMELVRSLQEKNVEVLFDDYLAALIFLTNVTGVASRAEYHHSLGYRNDQYYREDIQAWKKWLEKNKCKLTKAKIDSALSNQGCLGRQLETIFVNWNNATIESLTRQMQLSTDNIQMAMYKNRLLAVQEYWGIKYVDEFNSTSVRYKLLEAVFKRTGGRKNNFYVIEANEAGSKVLLRSFYLNIDTNHIVDVEFYDYINGQWAKRGEFKVSDIRLKSSLKSYITKFGKGFNYEDIIITEFRGNQVEESEYYLHSTLSNESKIKPVLDGYKKENFFR